MSDLHLALLLLAAVVLVALYGYSKWQERQALKRLQRLRNGVDDALLTAMPAPAPQRIEPRLEPGFGQSAAEPAAGAPPAVMSERGRAAVWVEDPLLDCALEVRCMRAVDGVAVLEAVAALQRNQFVLPVFVAAWDARAQQWVQADRFGFYTELLVAIQLATRRFALNTAEASHFFTAVQQLALTLEADVDLPEVAQVVAAAEALRATCARFDVQIGLTLRPRAEGPLATQVATAAARAGLVPAGAGRWERRVDEAPLFMLTRDRTGRLALEMDVPLAPIAAQPLRAMFETAQILAADLGADIVDDNGVPVDAAALAIVETQLESLYEQMRQSGIEPGSLRARRLYA
ncbi:MAG: cell division protein ZipA C-terminal FtsZ-binding domain-containing protein [Sutterellaceae bacterium]|nr:hypothetical protein [Burkholderiaceae bacterium]MCX7901517.1 hypothetical protein [Burkholderiaceae bacterium]MDW8430885.1 cell division protein ZipA C-terminal FtsZ-binding domain-containing protein [Sutterellaceae bacterium]